MAERLLRASSEDLLLGAGPFEVYSGPGLETLVQQAAPVRGLGVLLNSAAVRVFSI